MVKLTRPPGLWLNLQHDVFYTKHNLSMRSFVLSVSKSVIVDYISSPEVAFLRGVSQRFKATKTKLIFRFLEKEETDPSTNQTYGSLLNNLTFIKTFASGILVPKGYIWPVNKDSYLESSTLVVQNAHKEGLEVFGSDFINDIPFSYNYSYDPIAEVLNFIDNDAFSVDGVLSDFPITPSAAIDCFAHIGKNASGQEKPLIISYNGASGDYPSCTDLAYTKAISDGVDVLDCNVQMTKDGTPICLSSINLMDSTKVAQTPFITFTTTIAEVQKGSGIFTFNLTWENISSLTRKLKLEHVLNLDWTLSQDQFRIQLPCIYWPLIFIAAAISNPYSTFRLSRNPAAKTAGKLVSLSDFLSIAKEANSLSGGVLIGIEHAAFLVKVGLSVTDAVLDALSKAGYDNVTTPRVMIQSTNSSVLKEFKEKKKNYELVYRVDENIRDASDATIEDIKKFATSVVISKDSIYPENKAFITSATDIVSRLKKNNLPVYVQLFDNEFISQAWDFFSDATVEINSFVTGAGIDGVITSFPQTAASYRKNRCLKYKNVPSYMSPVQPGSLMQVITSDDMPPALAPYPVLTESDVAEPPLQEVAPATPASSTNTGTTAPAPTSPNGQPRIATCIVLSNLAVLLVAVLLL
ncbi:Glycerophosphodiester phosphodiesterase GDPDL4 [Vitis vinifera]|uniref:glycerophosphodiester phosphodiesterase n=1 Tax=Vitis vinifera TaxID=29760 RepID=A0A438GDG5_VITVI|nr:Glycerophosphodiester phosphodiesterase GDPDL4 [Vitis vinifera]